MFETGEIKQCHLSKCFMWEGEKGKGERGKGRGDGKGKRGKEESCFTGDSSNYYSAHVLDLVWVVSSEKALDV